MRLARNLVKGFVFIALASGPALAAHSAAPNQATLPRVDLVLWHQEGTDGIKQLGIQRIFDDWAKVNSPGSTLTFVQKEYDDLVPDFEAATGSGANASPDLDSGR